MDFNSFEKAIKSNKPLPVYVIYGDERFLAGQALTMVKERLLDKSIVDLSLVEYRGESVKFSEISDELCTGSLLGAEYKRLIIIENADSFLKKYEINVKGYIESPSSCAFLLLLCDKVSAWLKKQEGVNCAVAECKKIKDYQLESWLVKRGKLYKKILTSSAAKLLVKVTGNDLALLDNHLKKLSAFVGERDCLEVEDVDAIIFTGKKDTVFALTESVASKDLAAALQVLERLMSNGEEFPVIITILAWLLKRLCIGKRIVEECKGDSKHREQRLQSELKVNSYFLDKFIKQVNCFTEHELLIKYAMLADVDVELKTFSIEPELVLENLLIKLCK